MRSSRALALSLFLVAGCGESAKSPVDTTLPSDGDERAVSDTRCPEDTATLEIPAATRGGTLELLAPLMDTDAMAGKVYAARASTCIKLADLESLRRGAGLSESDALPLEVGFDPKGKGDSFRSRLDYSVLLPEELPDTPRPPTEMRFGEAQWNGGRVIRVEWHDDFRVYLEQSFSSTSLPAEQNEGEWSPQEAAVIENWLDLNGRCRGGSGDNEETWAACEERDGSASAQLAAAGICYGREGEYGYQHEMHRCGPGSYRSEG